MFIVAKLFKEIAEKPLQRFFTFLLKKQLRFLEDNVPNGSFSEYFFNVFKARKLRGYNPLQTVHCFPLGTDNTDQSKDLVGNYVISLETLDELAARGQIIFCCSWTNSHAPQRPDLS